MAAAVGNSGSKSGESSDAAGDDGQRTAAAQIDRENYTIEEKDREHELQRAAETSGSDTMLGKCNLYSQGAKGHNI